METSTVTLPNEVQTKNGNIISFFYKKNIKEKKYIAYYSLKENNEKHYVEGYGETFEEAISNLKIALNYFVSKQL